jgi:hypothetical protein
MWHVDPLLGKESANTFPGYKRQTIEGHPLLGNREINTPSWQQKTVFSVGLVPRSYKMAQSEDRKEYNGVVKCSQNSSVQSKKMTMCQIVICELL